MKERSKLNATSLSPIPSMGLPPSNYASELQQDPLAPVPKEGEAQKKDVHLLGPQMSFSTLHRAGRFMIPKPVSRGGLSAFIW